MKKITFLMIVTSFLFLMFRCSMDNIILKRSFDNCLSYIVKESPGPGYNYLYVFLNNSYGDNIYKIIHPCNGDGESATLFHSDGTKWIGITDSIPEYKNFLYAINKDAIIEYRGITDEERVVFKLAMENSKVYCGDYSLEKIIGFVRLKE